MMKINAKLTQEARILLEARESCHDLHGMGDIDASGDEVEKPCRDFLQRWLSRRLAITHGQIVDQSLNVSDQLDVVIADKLAAPPLYTSASETQYIPFESVYAVGELKATYTLSGVRDFCKKLRKLREDLSRKVVAGDELQIGDTTISGLRFGKPGRPPSNQLYSFYLALGTETDLMNRISRQSLSELYEEEWPDVPSCIMVLPQTAIVPMNLKLQGEHVVGSAPLLLPRSADYYAPDESYDAYWTAFATNLTSKEEIATLNLCLLLSALITHIQSSQLAPPQLFDYLKHAVQLENSRLVVLGPIVRQSDENVQTYATDEKEETSESKDTQENKDAEEGNQDAH
ncbi:MAG: hypothetical protein J0M35_00260 [Candidatus Obscuribacter phosphatis]|uniref:DUF6602 domain-containing protein n=1 Tax=Candidatus Obscuribacter phosphatis TaxID=1906157 RepID=A0A8J7TJN9_9BACT|nr:hypothetical protein [Candidatus Obscuribacter phosphatis]